MNALITYIIQLFLLLYILMTFKYKNNIVNVIAVFFTLFPIIGILSSGVIIGISICLTFILNEDWPQVKDNRLNRWLYNDYFKYI